MINRAVGFVCAGLAAGSMLAAPSPEVAPLPPTAAMQASGQSVYNDFCAVCHQATGEGTEEMYPPLAGSEWVNGDAGRMVRIVLAGVTGPISVAGVEYSAAMPPWGPALNDDQVAAVVTYVRSAWGNRGGPVTAAEVAAIRAATRERTKPWTVPELIAATAAEK